MSIRREPEAWLRKAQEISRLGNWDQDPVTGELWWSDQTYRLFGLDPQGQKMTFETFLGYVHPDDKPAIEEQTNLALSSDDHPYRVEYRITLPNQPERYVYEEARIERNEKGVATRIVGIIQDITERVKAEHERLDLKSQLHQKHKMEAVGYMAGGMAHNFNNNLSIILGNLELALIKLGPNGEISTMLENAKTAVHRSRDLVQNIITYSRKGLHEKSNILLSDIVDETITLLQSTLPSTIDLQINIDPDCRKNSVYADPSQIQEALINLCNNAFQAMKEEGQLTLQLSPVDLNQHDIPAQYDIGPGRFARLAIQDTGSGIDHVLLEKIFDPFFSTKPENEGAGMGLSTVQGIVAQHGGMITVDSELNVGTTFNLYFPLTQTLVSPEQQTPPEQVEIPRGTETILLVDDDKMLAELGKSQLSAVGYTVSCMTDSQEALKLFAANHERIDMVISDQTMPGMTGTDLLSEIRQIKPGIPTVLCTGFSNKVSKEDALAMGIDAYLMKPLDLMELLHTVRDVLDPKKPSAQPRHKKR